MLWNDDPRLPEPLLAELRRDPSLVVGDNEPYSAREPYEYTLTAHAQPRALPHCSLEVRQDLIDTPETARAWGQKADIADRRRRGRRPALTPREFAQFPLALANSGSSRKTLWLLPAPTPGVSAVSAALPIPAALAKTLWLLALR